MDGGGGAAGSTWLFPDTRLFFMIKKPEWVWEKFGWGAGSVSWDVFELPLSAVTQSCALGGGAGQGSTSEKKTLGSDGGRSKGAGSATCEGMVGAGVIVVLGVTALCALVWGSSVMEGWE